MAATQFIDDLATYLQTQGHGTKGTDLFRGNMPEATDDLIVINDTGGFPNIINDKGANIEVVTVQILARNKRQEEARETLKSIQDDLHQLVNTNLGTFTIIRALSTDRPAILQRDQKERWVLFLNLEIMMRNT